MSMRSFSRKICKKKLSYKISAIIFVFKSCLLSALKIQIEIVPKNAIIPKSRPVFKEKENDIRAKRKTRRRTDLFTKAIKNI